MITDTLPVNKFAQLNQLMEVTNPICFNPDRTPTSDGLFSYEIFGIPGSKERKGAFAKISFGVRVMHPFFYIILSQMDRRIEACAKGEKHFIINAKGELEEDEEQGGTGISWLYKNFDKLSYKRHGALRNKKILLKEITPKNEIFVDEWPVIPAFYRDVDMSEISSGRIKIGEVNDLYLRMLNLSMSIKKLGNYDNFMIHVTLFKLQQVLVELFRYMISLTSGKFGYFRRFVLGKNFDFSGRSVIATSKISMADTPEQLPVKIGEVGLPLYMAISEFKPFIIKNVREFLSGVIPEYRRVMYFGSETGLKPQKTDISFTLENLTDDKISSLISMYRRSWEHRWDQLKLIQDDGSVKPLYIFMDVLGHPFTITDLFFIAATYAVRDKYIWQTRYPIESMHSTNPVVIKIVTTRDTEVKDFSPLTLGKIDHYPKYLAHEWEDAMLLDNTKTSVMGADFDGDQLSQIPIFSQEANARTAIIANSKIAMVNLSGKPVNTITNEAVLGLYMMTKRI